MNESVNEHVTIGDIRRRYGISTVAPHSDAVTLTSVADELEDITPGALYLSPSSQYDSRIVHAAARRGAYAVFFMLPEQSKAVEIPIDSEIPVLFGNLRNSDRARICADLTGNPSQALAIFAVQGPRSIFVMRELYDVLHYLGNPLGVIDSRGGVSLERELWLKTPLSPLDVQRMLAIMAEDGATSVIVHVDDAVLETEALTQISIDVYSNPLKESYVVPQLDAVPHPEVKQSTQGGGLRGNTNRVARNFLKRQSSESRKNSDGELRKLARQNIQPYGAHISEQTACVDVSAEAKELVHDALNITGHSPVDEDAEFYDIATAVAMVLAAGVKKGSIKSALRLSREMKDEG
ncbi:hypothetical protein [Alloscardovia venturai]|uniref:hypothetical protein n=1 Tax=Alloscardovia venturai TaxID=1769421 RepID=UPI0036731F45